MNESQSTSISWSKINRYFALTLMLAAFLWLVIAARDLIGPLAISALLAYVLNPLVSFVNTRTKLPRKLVVPLVYLASLAALISLTITIAPIITDQVGSFVDELQMLSVQLETELAEPFHLAGIEIPLDQMISDIRDMSTGAIQPDMVIGIVQSATTNLAWMLIILVTTYYLLLDWSIFRNWLIGSAPTKYRDDAEILYAEIRQVWNNYMRGQLVLMLIIGVLTGLGLAALGVPGAAALGFLTGLLDAILSAGPAVAMITATAIAWVSGSSYLPLSNAWVAVIVLGIFGVIQMLENVWFRPRIMGTRVRLHPAIVFIGVMGALALAGVLVALIIIPLMSSIMIVGRYIYCRIIEEDPWENYKFLGSSRENKTAVSPDLVTSNQTIEELEIETGD